MSPQVDNEPSRSHPSGAELTRVIALAVAVAAVIALVVTFRGAMNRGGGTAAAAAGPDAYDLLVTAPTEPELFPDTVLWSLPSERARVFADSQQRPVVRLGSSSDAVLVGLESSAGLVALALVPPGLGERPPELLISPRSTALALAALHPEMSGGEATSHLARMAAIAAAPSFAELVAQVDGQPLAQWTAEERATLARVVSESLRAGATADCADLTPVEGSILRCGVTGQLQNVALRSVLVAEQGGRPCAIVPPTRFDITVPGRDALARLIGDGAAIDGVVDELIIGPIPGVADGSDCGPEPRVFIDNVDFDALGYRSTIWSDVTVPLARLIGADPALVAPTVVDDALVSVLETEAISVGRTPPAAEQVKVGAAYLRSGDAARRLGLLPVSDDVEARLRELVTLLGAVYS